MLPARSSRLTATPNAPCSPGHPQGASRSTVLTLQKGHIGVRCAHLNLRVLRRLSIQLQHGPRLHRQMSSAGPPCPHRCRKDTICSKRLSINSKRLLMSSRSSLNRLSTSRIKVFRTAFRRMRRSQSLRGNLGSWAETEPGDWARKKTRIVRTGTIRGRFMGGLPGDRRRRSTFWRKSIRTMHADQRAQKRPSRALGRLWPSRHGKSRCAGWARGGEKMRPPPGASNVRVQAVSRGHWPTIRPTASVMVIWMEGSPSRRWVAQEIQGS